MSNTSLSLIYTVVRTFGSFSVFSPLGTNASLPTPFGVVSKTHTFVSLCVHLWYFFFKLRTSEHLMWTLDIFLESKKIRILELKHTSEKLGSNNQFWNFLLFLWAFLYGHSQLWSDSVVSIINVFTLCFVWLVCSYFPQSSIHGQRS